MAHFMRQNDKINKLCTNEISNIGSLAALYKLHDSYWVVVTCVEFPLGNLHITCKKGSPQVIKQQFDIGMHVIVLNPDCSADSKYFHILKFASRESNEELIAKIWSGG